MSPISYRRVGSAKDVLQNAGGHGQRWLGGGTNLVDLMRKGVEHPSELLDVTGLSDMIELADRGSLVIGAAARNSAVAGHPLVRTRYPMLSRAILSGASAQIRNMATVGGNLMQRTRCLYFQDAAGSRCNKRMPGSGCDAHRGFNRYHAVVGGSSACIATHPSDMCVALAALDTIVHVTGPAGPRTIPVVDFHRLPGEQPHIETALAPSELIVAIELPASPFAGASAYRKVRDRASYAFALVSVAVGLTMQNNRIGDIRIAIGGIAPKPWRARRAEAALLGGLATLQAFEHAAAEEFVDAAPPAGAAFKVDLAKRALVSMLADLSGNGR